MNKAPAFIVPISISVRLFSLRAWIYALSIATSTLLTSPASTVDGAEPKGDRVAFFTSSADVYRVVYGNGIQVAKAPLGMQPVQMNGETFLKLESLPQLPKAIGALKIVSVAGSGWMKTGFVLWFVVKTGDTGKYNYYWATYDRHWAVGRTDLATSISKAPFKVLAFTHSPDQGDLIEVRLARLDIASKDVLTYIHGCPVATFDKDSGHFYGKSNREPLTKDELKRLSQ